MDGHIKTRFHDMGKSFHFKWEKEYSVGIYQIDVEHKEIIKLINGLLPFFDLNDAEFQKTFILMVQSVIEYFRHHFENEEKIMLEKHYPKYQEHKENHNKMLIDINNLMKEISENNKMGIKKVIVYFQEWLLEHFWILDKEMGKYFIKSAQNNNLSDIV
ncbi:MAG: bacteriohemerythrin [Treponema sp.]|jgi:hemerythrin|nr:bacteriohemerythrin [Treponema sp.]